MANGKSKTTDKTSEEKPTYFSAVSVVVKSLKLVRMPTNEQHLKAVKFVTSDNKEILYYPKHDEVKFSSIADYETELTEQKPYSISEFITNNPMLNKLAKDLKNDMREIVVSYQENMFKGIKYCKMFKNQFDLIYYEGYHGSDKTNLDKQLANKQKYELNYEMPIGGEE